MKPTKEAIEAARAAILKAMAERDDAIAERDALAARLAPVEGEALVEIVAKHFIKENKKSPYTCWKKAARDAIAAIRPHIEAAERERCAKIADKHEHVWHSELAHPCARAIAAAIRSGK